MLRGYELGWRCKYFLSTRWDVLGGSQTANSMNIKRNGSHDKRKYSTEIWAETMYRFLPWGKQGVPLPAIHISIPSHSPLVINHPHLSLGVLRLQLSGYLIQFSLSLRVSPCIRKMALALSEIWPNRWQPDRASAEMLCGGKSAGVLWELI